MVHFRIIIIFYLFVGSIQIYSQKERILISGEIKNDSLPIENVHIINTTSNTGSLSNKNGEFKIPVKENDTLYFSDIQYFVKELIITNTIINKKSLTIFLKIKSNELDEIIIVESKNMAKALGLPNADKKPLNKLERKLNYYSQASTPIVILLALIGKQGGIDDIYNIISGNRKKDRKLKSLLDEDKKLEITQEYIKSIRNHFQDEFFIETIGIPKEKIDSFINYCLPKNIVFLFNKSRYLEIIDIFIAEGKTFKLLD
jgi:cellobiose phosphorylase